MSFANSNGSSSPQDQSREVTPSDLFIARFHRFSPVEPKPNRPADHHLPISLPSPAPSTGRAASSASSPPQDPRSTTLPSFRELETYPVYLPSPPLDMSRPSQTHVNPAYDLSFEKHPYGTRDLVHNSLHPHNNRVIQGEPTHAAWSSSYSSVAPMVTSISPHEMHRSTPFATDIVRSAATVERRKPVRGEPNYQKRPRRRAEEVERLYTCKWPGCDKSYGALNHLNTHVRNAEHGPKREPKEFQEIRRQQKAKLAREREQKHSNVFRHSEDAVYRVPPHMQTSMQEFAQFTSDTLVPRNYESSPAPSIRPHHPNYPPHMNASRAHYEGSSDRGWGTDITQNWLAPSSSHMAPSRWSPDNYNDLHSRHPSVAKDLLNPSIFRETTLSPRDLEIPWNDERYDSVGHGSYVQGPNGSGNVRDPHHRYLRKEF